jgi:dienelactone hydrolase
MDNLIDIIPDLQAKPFDIPAGNGGVIRSYLCLGGNADTAPKRLVLLLQGSSSSSVFARKDNSVMLPFGVVPLMRHRPDWHLVVVEKRGVSLGQYFESSGTGDGRKISALNPIQVLAADAARVVDFFARSVYYDGTDILVVGHSSGSDVAPLVAQLCSQVTLVGMLASGGGPGLFMHWASLRASLRRGDISAQEFTMEYQAGIDTCRDLLRHPETADDESYNLWGSGVASGVEEQMENLSVPVFMAIPSLDPAETADLVAAKLIARGKQVTIRNYLNCDHGFFENAHGEMKNRQYEVTDDLVAWANEISPSTNDTR